MKYTLTTYRDGKKLSEWPCFDFHYALKTAADVLLGATDEYEITDEGGYIVAHAMKGYSPKVIQADSEREQSRKEAKSDRMADIAREEQQEELASREAQRGIR